MSRFWIVDVFAERKYAGNPLAVVTDDGSLEPDTMQRIARETNFSETTFVRPKARAGGWDVRIFTPAQEIPFAGHPTLGTAAVIREALAPAPEPPTPELPESVVLHLAVGDVPVRFAEDGLAWMTPPEPELGAICDPALLARALGLDAADLDPAYPVQAISTGIIMVFVPLASLDAARRARLRLDVLPELREAGVPTGVFVFTRETESPDCRIHARLFAPDAGVPEDPATGSANACLAAWLVRHRYLGEGPVDARVEQGIEMGRPSILHLVAREDGERVHVEVGGRVVFVAHGDLV